MNDFFHSRFSPSSSLNTQSFRLAAVKPERQAGCVGQSTYKTAANQKNKVPGAETLVISHTHTHTHTHVSLLLKTQKFRPHKTHIPMWSQSVGAEQAPPPLVLQLAVSTLCLVCYLSSSEYVCVVTAIHLGDIPQFTLQLYEECAELDAVTEIHIRHT